MTMCRLYFYYVMSIRNLTVYNVCMFYFLYLNGLIIFPFLLSPYSSATLGAGFTKPLRLARAGLSDRCMQKMHALVRGSSFGGARGLRYSDYVEFL